MFIKKDENEYLPPPVLIDNSITLNNYEDVYVLRHTRYEFELLAHHASGGICHTHAKAIDWVINEPFIRDDNSTAAKIIYAPEPKYWKQLVREKTEYECPYPCKVIIRATLTADGKMTNFSFLDFYSQERLADIHDAEFVKYDRCVQSSLDAAKRIRFEPATKNGNPISQKVSIFYDSEGWKDEVKK